MNNFEVGSLMKSFSPLTEESVPEAQQRHIRGPMTHTQILPWQNDTPIVNSALDAISILDIQSPWQTLLMSLDLSNTPCCSSM